VVVLLGPTAVGKTDLSISLAKELRGEVVSVDSRLLYRGLNIGTAKPSDAQRQAVPHHLIDVTDPMEPWSLARYKASAMEAVAKIHRKGRLPFLVGGTGQYLVALLEGWEPPPKSSDDSLRNELFAYADEYGASALHQRLADVDPHSAERIPATNIRRVVRALEIIQITGKPASAQRVKNPPAWEVLKVGLRLPREELYGRIDARIEAMMEAGLVDEVRGLIRAGCALETPAMSAIGYKQIAQVLQGQSTLEDAVQEMRRLTRQYVRRQANWFRNRIPDIHWFEARPGVAEKTLALLGSWLDEVGFADKS
jgi:tRNA dimethylallyltransferase